MHIKAKKGDESFKKVKSGCQSKSNRKEKDMKSLSYHRTVINIFHKCLSDNSQCCVYCCLLRFAWFALHHHLSCNRLQPCHLMVGITLGLPPKVDQSKIREHDLTFRVNAFKWSLKHKEQMLTTDWNYELKGATVKLPWHKIWKFNRNCHCQHFNKPFLKMLVHEGFCGFTWLGKRYLKTSPVMKKVCFFYWCSKDKMTKTIILTLLFHFPNSII